MKLDLNNYEKVKKFVNLAQKYSIPLTLVSGRYVVDAKSILGIFSLDLSKPVDLIIDSDNFAEIKNEFKEFEA